MVATNSDTLDTHGTSQTGQQATSTVIRSPHEKYVRLVAFVVRCAGAATAAYGLCSLLALPEVIWAAMSAVIVSQERLHETRSSLICRIFGTLIGIGAAVAVSEVASRVQAPTALQIAAATAICAFLTRSFPKLRVAMWTCQIVLLTAGPSSIALVALTRAGQVILGAIIGYAFHHAAELAVDALVGAKSTSWHPIVRS